jgi:hypothetical protein
MAVTETVKIVFEVDDKQVTDSVAELAKLGKVSQEDAAKFKQLGDASKAAGASMSAAAKGAKELSTATAEIGKSAVAIKDTATNAQAAADGFVPLRTRLKEAKLELQQLSEEFGPFSAEANAARARAGELSDEFADLNRQVNLLNPDGKIAAFNKLGQGVVGAFSVATGALQAFGAENEEVQKIAQKLQGALNIAQGIQSIVGLKEAYEDVKAVLGFTTAAQNTLTTAQGAGKLATEGAAAANVKFAASLSATGIGAIVIALGALVGAFLLYSNSTEEAKVNEEALKKAQDASKDSTDKLRQAVGELQVLRGQKTEEQLKKENLAAQSTENQIKLQKVLGEAISEQLNAQKEFDKLGRGAAPAIREERQARLDAAKAAVAQAAGSIQAEKDALKASQTFIDEEKKKKDAIDATDKAKQASEKADQKAEQAIQKRLQSLAEEQKVRQFSVELNKEYGATEEEIARQKILNNELDQEALNAILKQAEGTQQYENIQSDLNDKVREEVLLRKQLEKLTEIPLIPLKNQLDAQAKVNDKIKEEGPIRVAIAQTSTDLNNEQFKQEEEFANLQQQRIDRAFAIANQVTEIFIESAQRQNEEEIASLEERREQGLITEEQYEVKLRQLKRKGAEDQKKAQVFQATMSVAQAILSALTIIDPVAKTTAIALAATLGALNLAKIIATPIPKFKQGTLAVPGHDTGDDSVMAMLRPGEAVIPTETNREYAAVIRAIYTKKVSANELNEFVTSRDKRVSTEQLTEFMNSRNLTTFNEIYNSRNTTQTDRNEAKFYKYFDTERVIKSKKNTEVQLEPVLPFNPVTMEALFKRDLKVSNFNNTVVKRTGGDMPTIKVKADVDTQQLTRAMAKNKAVELSNSQVLAKALAQEIAKTQNPRRQ